MTSRDTVLALLRADERRSLASLPVLEPPPRHAMTVIPITRRLYAEIETPPTRHGTFFVQTLWRRQGWVAEGHRILVKRGRGHRVVVEQRAGRFGECTQEASDVRA